MSSEEGDLVLADQYSFPAQDEDRLLAELENPVLTEQKEEEGEQKSQPQKEIAGILSYTH